MQRILWDFLANRAEYLYAFYSRFENLSCPQGLDHPKLVHAKSREIGHQTDRKNEPKKDRREATPFGLKYVLYFVVMQGLASVFVDSAMRTSGS